MLARRSLATLFFCVKKNPAVAKRTWFLCLCYCLMMLPMTGMAAGRRYFAEEDNNVATREMRDSIEALRHEVGNHETEIRMFEERVNNQESTIGSLRQQVLDATQANKELMKGHHTSLEVKISSLESANKGLMADMVKLKSHANDSAATLEQYKLKIHELEKMLGLQNQNLEHLQSAIRSLMDAMQVKDSHREEPRREDSSSIKTTTTTDASGIKSYRIKAGDNLEKIARQHNTSVKAIKELNHLSNDKIVVGQTLEIP